MIGWEETARNRASLSTIFSHFLILSGSVKLQLLTMFKVPLWVTVINIVSSNIVF